MAPVIQTEALEKSFYIPTVQRTTLRAHFVDLFRPRPMERLEVLRSVTFRVEPGEAVAILGRNGSGKSTLLKLLCGIYAPDGGRLTVAAPFTPLLELGVGWNQELDAIDNILLIGTVMGMSLKQAKASVDEILDFSGLERFARTQLKHYSSGMASRLAYATAFSAVRDILMIDEIFAVGDAGFKLRCYERFKRFHQQGHTLVVVSHDPDFVRGHCQRAVMLERGEVVFDGSAAEGVAQYLARAATDSVQPHTPGPG